MTPPAGRALPSAEDLLAAHRLYDQYVDVVTAFEWLFTDTKQMPETVRHFERFPSLRGDDGEPATPDFSVLFTDGTGLVAEIARIALHDASVDSLCHQIGRYDRLRQIPDVAGFADVEQVDVLLLVPMELGTAVVQRVLRDRLLHDDHEYAPARTPCVVQYVADRDKYVFQRQSAPENGTLDGGDRETHLGAWLAVDDFKPPASGFASLKAARPFMNDPVAPLYLASQLWTKVFATRAAAVTAVADYKPLVLTADDIASDLRQQYGRGSNEDVRRAMEVLVAARSAQVVGPNRWRVAWGSLAHNSGEDVSGVLARRTEKPPARGTIKRLLEAYEDLGVEDPLAHGGDAEERLFPIEDL